MIPEKIGLIEFPQETATQHESHGILVGIEFVSTDHDKSIKLEHAREIYRRYNAHQGLLDACKWIGKFILTASDGGDAWCSIRNQPGASKWAKDLEAAIAAAEGKE